MGEPTISLYSPSTCATQIIPALVAIPNLTWISSNHFVPGWEGNYTRGRPTNIEQVVQGLDAQMRAAIPDVVDLSRLDARAGQGPHRRQHSSESPRIPRADRQAPVTAGLIGGNAAQG